MSGLSDFDHSAQGRPGFVAAAGAEFSARFLSADDCAIWIAGQLHPRGPLCPGCGHEGPGGRGARRFFLFRRVQCSECGRFFSAASGTWLAGAKLDPRQIMLLAALFSYGVEIQVIARVVEVSEVTVRYWVKKFQMLERFEG